MKITNKTVPLIIISTLFIYPFIHYFFEEEGRLLTQDVSTNMEAWRYISVVVIGVVFVVAFLGLQIGMISGAIEFEYHIRLPWQKSQKQKELDELYTAYGKEIMKGNQIRADVIFLQIQSLESQIFYS